MYNLITQIQERGAECSPACRGLTVKPFFGGTCPSVDKLTMENSATGSLMYIYPEIISEYWNRQQLLEVTKTREWKITHHFSTNFTFDQQIAVSKNSKSLSMEEGNPPVYYVESSSGLQEKVSAIGLSR
jgi:hypothetical protein